MLLYNLFFSNGTHFTCVVLTDVRTALIGVGLVIKDDKSGLTILDKGEAEYDPKLHEQRSTTVTVI